MGTFSWRTSDTGESISPRDKRTVYLLQPNGLPPIAEPAYAGYGDFGHTDAYVWLAENNIPKERLALLTDDQIRTAGVSLGVGRYFVDAVTGAKIAIFHEGATFVDPEIAFHAIKYSDPVPGYDGRSANDLAAAGHLISTQFNPEFPLKFSYDPTARYEDLPAAEDCPHQGYPPRSFDFDRSKLCYLNVYYGEAHPFWDVCFTPLQFDYADRTTEEITRISVTIDAEDGRLSLNPGYTEGSPQYEDENSLFETMQLAIVEALTRELPADNPAYAKFLADAAEYAEDRRDGLNDLEAALQDFQDDLEDEG